MISVAMIGAGTIAASHLSAIAHHPNTYLCAVADLSAERAQNAAAPYNATTYTDYIRMLDIEKPQVAIINLPHSLHEAAVFACAERGIHIFLEKPMSISEESCIRMNAICDEKNVLLQVGHIQGFIPQNCAARDLIQSGRLGKLIMINDLRTINYFVPTRPRWFLNKKSAGGGIWMNYGAHALDKLCFLSGSKISSVSGNCTYPKELDVDGSAQVLAYTENGITATITLCGYSVVPIHETMIYLTEGSLRLRTGESLQIACGDHYEDVDTSLYPDPFDAQWDVFIRGLHEGRILVSNGYYATDIIRHIESLWK